MRRRRPRTLAAALAATAALGACGNDDDRRGTATADAPRPRLAVNGTPQSAAPAPRDDMSALRARARAGKLAARVLRRTALRASPGGRRIARIRTRTGYDSERVMAVGAVRGAWVGVRAPERPNGRLGWVAARDVELLRTTWQIEVDLSERKLTAHRPGRATISMPVAIGSSASPTPTGRFGVTDRLVLDPGTPYGCCILALSGHQPNVPQGWGGGDRIAIHGTTNEGSIGNAVSGGCVRARRVDMRRLMRVIPNGTTVVVRA